jgi:hypothetical protein
MQNLKDYFIFIRNVIVSKAYNEYKTHMNNISIANDMSLTETITADITEHNMLVWNAVFHKLHFYMRYYQLLHHKHISPIDTDYTFLFFDTTTYDNNCDNIFYPPETFEQYIQSKIGTIYTNRQMFDKHMNSEDGVFKKKIVKKWKQSQQENIMKYGISQHVYYLASMYDQKIQSDNIKPHQLFEPTLYLDKTSYLDYKKTSTQHEKEATMDEIHFRTLEEPIFTEIDKFIPV